VRQSRNQLDAVQKLVALARQVLEMQQEKFTRALCAVEEVITAQQNLAIDRGHVVRAHVAYAKALIQYEEVTGTLLERHNVEMSEAVNGEVRSVPNALGPHGAGEIVNSKSARAIGKIKKAASAERGA
jgi:hypothetical protein